MMPYFTLLFSSDRGIMASGSADAPAAPESSDAPEECPGNFFQRVTSSKTGKNLPPSFTH